VLTPLSHIPEPGETSGGQRASLPAHSLCVCVHDCVWRSSLFISVMKVSKGLAGKTSH